MIDHGLAQPCAEQAKLIWPGSIISLFLHRCALRLLECKYKIEKASWPSKDGHQTASSSSSLLAKLYIRLLRECFVNASLKTSTPLTTG
jgi:hypothetical protein